MSDTICIAIGHLLGGEEALTGCLGETSEASEDYEEGSSLSLPGTPLISSLIGSNLFRLTLPYFNWSRRINERLLRKLYIETRRLGNRALSLALPLIRRLTLITSTPLLLLVSSNLVVALVLFAGINLNRSVDEHAPSRM